MSVKIFDTMTTATPNFPLAYAEKINVKLQDGTEDNLQNLFDNGELGGGDDSITLTQQEYEALTEEQKLDGLYYTYDTKRIYKNGVQYGASEPIPLTMAEYKALKEAGAIDEQQEYLIEANEQGILLSAEDIGYNNAESGIQATTVQGAISAVNANLGELEDNIGGKNNRKKIAIFGGSVAVNGYNALKDSIKKALNTEIVDNYAIGGYGFSSLQGSIQTEVNSAISSGNNYDVFILWASSNDYTNSREIGSYKDYTVLDSYNETKLTTQCGGINYCIKKILEHNPKAEIYFITSNKCYDKESGYNTFYCGKENKLYSYVSAQKQCCAYYSIPILDLWSMMGINELNRSVYYIDDIHINTDGYDKIKNLIIDMIKNGSYNGAPQTEQTKDYIHPLMFASDNESALEISPESNKLVHVDPNIRVSSHYTIKNGVCYVNVAWVQTDAVTDHTWLLINLPKPIEMIQCIGCSRSLFDGKAIPIYGYIPVEDTYIDEFGYKLKIYGGNNDSRGFRMSFSYVIDE